MHHDLAEKETCEELQRNSAVYLHNKWYFLKNLLDNDRNENMDVLRNTLINFYLISVSEISLFGWEEKGFMSWVFEAYFKKNHFKRYSNIFWLSLEKKLFAWVDHCSWNITISMRREVFREFTFGSLFNNYLQPYLSIFESNEKDKCQSFWKILETFKKS